MNFKDIIKKDIHTFINQNEFAEEHNINGAIIKCVIDEDISKERNINKETVNMKGIFYNEVSLFIEKKHFLRIPKIEELMSIDDYNYRIKDISDSEGILEFELIRADY